METMRTAKELAKELLTYLDQESNPTTAIVRLRNSCLRELAPAQPALVEKRVAEALSILQRLGLPANRLAAFTLLAFVQVGFDQAWGEAQRKSLRLHDVLAWIGEQYGVRYAENTRESLRRDVIAPMVQAGVLEHNPDSPGLPPNHPKNHYAIHIDALEKIRQYQA
jgi:adenine-specific DNA-methyltransferase